MCRLRKSVRGWLLPLMGVVLAIGRLPAAATAGESLDAQFVAGLCERRLFALAERYCKQELARGDLSPEREAELTVELIRTLTLSAIHAPTTQQPARWGAARQVAADFYAKGPAHPRLLLVRFQEALTPLAQGELARYAHQASALRPEPLDLARTALREAATLLEALDKDLTREAPLRRRATLRPGDLSAEAISGLQLQTQHQLARAYINRALLFDPGTDDRLALLLQTAQLLEKTLATLPAEEPLAGPLRLDLAICRRWLGEHEAAQEQLSEVARGKLSTEIRSQLQAEQIRLALARGELSRAEQQAKETAETTPPSAELGLARLEAYAALAAQASRNKDAAAAQAWEASAIEVARALGETHGPYWRTRADELLLAILPESAAGFALLGRKGDSLYVKGDASGAIAAYDRAAELAGGQGDVAAAFELSYKAALVEQQRQNHGETARRLRKLASELATHPQAAEAHLTAAWHAAKLAEREPAAADEYAAMLREHLALWPRHASSAQIRLWLGRLCQVRGDWRGAIEAYAAIPRTSAHFLAAMQGIEAAAQGHLPALAQAGQPTLPAAEDIVRRLEQALHDREGKLPATWAEGDRAAALAAARLRLGWQVGTPAEAESLLQAALDGAPAPAALWQAEAKAQLVVALALQPGKASQAQSMLHAASAASPENVLAMVTNLGAARERVPAENRQAIAEVQLAATKTLSPRAAELSAAGQRYLARLQAEALAAAGDWKQGAVLYAQLAKAHPGDGTIQEGYADLLLTGPDEDAWRSALAQWRLVASRARPHSDRWYRAKHAIALAQLKLGDRAGAATLIRYLLEAPPGVTDAEWRAKFTQLLKQCEG